jgi:hypothetical protein
MSELKQLKIEEYNLVDFVMKIQQGIRDGYEVTDQSDDAPLQIGGGFYTIMREAVKPNITVGKLVMEASIDTTKLQEQLKAGGEIEQMLADSLVVEEKLHETSIDHEKDVDKWDNKELGADEAYVETIEPPKEPTLDESLPKEEQAMLQNKQPTKRGKKA